MPYPAENYPSRASIFQACDPTKERPAARGAACPAETAGRSLPAPLLPLTPGQGGPTVSLAEARPRRAAPQPSPPSPAYARVATRRRGQSPATHCPRATLVNALAGNGVGHPVLERMVWKPKPLIEGRLQMLSREEMSIQIRLTGQRSLSASWRGWSQVDGIFGDLGLLPKEWFLTLS